MAEMVLAGLWMGLCATVLFDLWGVLLNRVAGLPLPNWGVVGRWAAGLARGRVFPGAIAEAPEVPGEVALGWAFHYAVGLVYGLVFAVLAGPAWLAAPNFWPAWIFALVTIAAGWFLLHPGLGLGWAASKTPNPWRVRGLGLVAHSVFGLGLWGGALAL